VDNPLTVLPRPTLLLGFGLLLACCLGSQAKSDRAMAVAPFLYYWNLLGLDLR
jgi:hypothetical protein